MTEPTPEELPEELPEPEKKPEPFATTSDLIVVLVLIVLGGAGWLWYSGARTDSSSRFHQADSLYRAGNLPGSLAAYRALRSSESVIAKKDDSLMYKRMDSLEGFEEKDLQMAEAARAAIASEDTSLIRAAYEGVTARSHGFVPRTLIDSLKR